MIDRTPRVFISYSWTSTKFQQQVKELAEKLVHDGIDVVLDIWDLKDGQDKFHFMEQCVTDPQIDRVLIICDSGYAEKADARKGGVGDETAIISPEIYGNAEQEKFIPVIMEYNQDGKPFIPAYLKGRMYKDLAGDNYLKGYKSLLRNIYECPSERKPELGHRPTWLDEKEADDLFSIKEAKQKVEIAELNGFKSSATQEFVDVYLESLKKYYKDQFTNEEYLKDFEGILEYRNIFLEYIQNIALKTEHYGIFLADTFEKLYNTLYDVHTFKPRANTCGYDSFDIFKVHIWELFICTTAYLLHIEDYESINELLVHTYFLRISPLLEEMEPVSYEAFCFTSKVLERKVKPNMPGELCRKFTLTGHFLCTEREFLPVYTKKRIAEADLFLYQVYNGLDLDQLTKDFGWFPICYVYSEEHNSMWKKLKSKNFCEKIMPIFGVKSIDELKKKIEKCVSDNMMRYRESGYAATAILDWVKIEEIAALP